MKVINLTEADLREAIIDWALRKLERRIDPERCDVSFKREEWAQGQGWYTGTGVTYSARVEIREWKS